MAKKPAKPKKGKTPEQVKTLSKVDRIRAYAAEMNTKLKKSNSAGRIDVGQDIQFMHMDRASSGSLGLDIIANGGLPRGGMTEMWGPYSTGKTSMTLVAVREAQMRDESVAWAVSEAFDKDWARKLGVLIPFTPEELEEIAEEEGQDVADDLEAEQKTWPAFTLIQHQYGDALLELMVDAVKQNLFDICALDSLGSIKSYANVEERSLEDRQYGGESILFGAFVGKLYSALNTKYDPHTGAVFTGGAKDKWVPNRTAVLCINQARQEIGGYNPTGQKQYKRSGGEALYHAWHLSVQFKKGPLAFKEGREKRKLYYKQEMRAVGEKSKIGPPRRSAEWDFYLEDHEDFQAGDIDTAKELRDWGLFYGLIESRGSSYEILGDVKVKGKDNVPLRLAEDEELAEELREQILEQAIKMK